MENILVLTDFSHSAAMAANAAVGLAIKLEANIILLNTYLTTPEPGGVLKCAVNRSDALHNEAGRLTHLINRHGAGSFKPGLKIMQEQGMLSANVEMVLRGNAVLMVIMGSRSKINSNSFYGSDIYAVINKATCPVLVIPDSQHQFVIHNLVFLTDMPTTDLNAAEYLAKLAKILKFDILISPVTDQVMVMDLLEADEPACFTGNVSKLNGDAVCLANLQGDNFSQELITVKQPVKTSVIAIVHKKHYLYWRLFNQVQSKVLSQHNKASFLILPES
ncbi:universal stress protein [Mucilaginibacter flavidus]|uniref:universal stress protein n=1 Tax=Mucilaginibacter flavidus TaxID=2949309 RepID=UPI002092C3E4|nr:universal stress protein [Mucilaginibacter flavidus]MCO5946603.1 universal stress protein [Mucilaginibacter flavidus]